MPAASREQAAVGQHDRYSPHPLGQVSFQLGRAYYNYVGFLECVLAEVGLDKLVLQLDHLPAPMGDGPPETRLAVVPAITPSFQGVLALLLSASGVCFVRAKARVRFGRRISRSHYSER